ncbi:GumC family protein [Segatella asaccharophila]
MIIADQTNDTRQYDNPIHLQDLLDIFLPKWYWFIISLSITLFIAALYILMTPPLYTSTASILIKNTDSKSGGDTGGDESTGIQDLGIFKNNTNINNELLTLQSPTLMTEVVKRLNLNEIYTVNDGLQKRELYHDTPVIVTFLRPRYGNTISFTIRSKGRNQVTLSDFPGIDKDKKITVTLGIPVNTPVGTLTLTASPNYSDTWTNIPIKYAQIGLESIADNYTSRLQARLDDKNATIITLSIKDTSKKKSKDILNELIKVYNENWILDKNRMAVSTSHFIDNRLRVIERELNNVDASISNYKSMHLLPDVEDVASQYLTQNSENRKILLDLNSQLSTAQYIYKELKKQNYTQPLPASLDINDTGLQYLANEYNTILLARNKLLSSSSERNPLVQEQTKSLYAIRASVMKSVDNIIASLYMQIDNLSAQESNTENQLSSNPKQARYLLSVERQQKVKEKLYLYLLQKREENQLSQTFTAYNTRIITAPRGSESPTSPRKSCIFLIAFTVGLLVPAIFLFIKENNNTHIRGRKDLESLTIPFIGEIPLVHEGKRKKYLKSLSGRKTNMTHRRQLLVVKEKNKNLINEAFRVVRTNLEFMAGSDNPHKVIISTSANPASGKTFITINLAVSLAIKSKKILVIDLDLRQAALSNYIDHPRTGISNYLGGLTTEVKDIIIHSKEYPTLDIIPVGIIPPNPTELLFSKRLEDLIAKLKNEYDYVFIDCPPIGIVADTSIIGKWADITLFIIRAELIERDMLPATEELYTKKKLNNMAVLLNGTTAAYGGRHGYHYYGYRYGYNYGYGFYNYNSYEQKTKR